MEKLEPLIRHKFWIIFGLTLPIALFAFYSASGKMTEATTAQEAKLEGARNGVPKGDAEPNETFAAGAKVINEDLDARFQVQVQRLWEMQTERMTWPKIVVPFVPEKYRGNIESKARYTYMRVYPSVVERLWERVQPYVGDPKMSRSPTSRTLVDFKADWPQKVIIDGHKIPHTSFDMSAPAENEEIWDAQEDIWLLELIFDAVVRTNKDAQFVSDAPIRQIDKIELVGGSGESSVTATATVGTMGEDGGDYGMSEMEDYLPTGEMGGGGGFGGKAKVAFDVTEEFGAPVPEASADAPATASASSGEEDYGEYDTGGMMGFGGRNVKYQRYIGAAGFDPYEGSYRERGFYMSVIILQDRIPDFLAELSSSPWPIRIGRFHLGANPYATSASPSGGGRGFGMDYSESEMYESESYSEMAGGMFSGGGFGGGFGMGMGGAKSTLKLPDYMKMPTSIAPELRSHPDLVQMDFCGIITMYNPVTDDTVEKRDDGSTEEDFQDDLEATAETPEEAQAQAAQEAADAAAEAVMEVEVDPNAPAPAEAATPPAEPAASEPPATPAPRDAAPAAEPPVENTPPADPGAGGS